MDARDVREPSPAVRAAAKEYVAIHTDSKPYPYEKRIACCFSVSEHMVHFHQSGFTHFVIARKLSRTAFRTAIADELRYRRSRQQIVVVR